MVGFSAATQGEGRPSDFEDGPEGQPKGVAITERLGLHLIERLGILTVEIWGIGSHGPHNDYRPAHVHVIFPGGEIDIVVNLRWPPTIREIRGNEKGRDPNKALDAVAANYAVRRAKWKNVHGRFS